MSKVIIQIEGMACSHCTSNVTASLSALNGVEDVKVSLEDKNAEIAYDASKVTVDALSDVIEELGFGVTGKSEA